MARRQLDHVPLTKEVLSAAYEYARATPPFNKWNMPEPEEIVFRIGKDPKFRGWYRIRGGRHEITISSSSCGYTCNIIRAMMHEMLHLYQNITRQETSGALHNTSFNLHAAEICSIHGFDAKEF